ncbi:MAG TPA: glycogen/starch synthase [Polyangiaceae bacterium]
MISSEVETFARTGGLGDAVYGLSRALARLGHDVSVVTPLYGTTPIPPKHYFWEHGVLARVGWGVDDVRTCGVCEVRDESVTGAGGTLRFCLLAEDALFGARRGIYGDASGTFGDNELRFATLSRGALEVAARVWPDGPDVIHAHDWHAALAPIYAKSTMGEFWSRIRSVFTVHNLAYQGVLDAEALDRLAIPRGLFHDFCLRDAGNVNLLKGAVALSDAVTTVSPTYAREIQRDQGFWLERFFRRHTKKLVGIANGIDQERFDPHTEPGIAERYDDESVWRGKWACKQALAAELDIDWPDAPLFACVSRLTEQKGVDLLVDTLGALVERGARVVLIGKGEPRLEDMIHHASLRYPGHVASRVAFDPALATRVYAGADFVIVPSRFEPCGLTQLYAMRFGAVPIVTDVGGLHDTVAPANLARGSGTGFVAASPSVVDLLVAFEDALGAFLARGAFNELRQRAMRRDSSWRTSALEYVRVYEGSKRASAT